MSIQRVVATRYSSVPLYLIGPAVLQHFSTPVQPRLCVHMLSGMHMAISTHHGAFNPSMYQACVMRAHREWETERQRKTYTNREYAHARRKMHQACALHAERERQTERQRKTHSNSTHIQQYTLSTNCPSSKHKIPAAGRKTETCWCIRASMRFTSRRTSSDKSSRLECCGGHKVMDTILPPFALEIP